VVVHKLYNETPKANKEPTNANTLCAVGLLSKKQSNPKHAGSITNKKGYIVITHFTNAKLKLFKTVY
jgi:hypothetical protein